MLEKAAPEEEGVSSDAIVKFLKSIRRVIPLRTLLIARHGKLIVDAECAPFTKNTVQRMFSCTKSFTSLAVGLLVSDGAIKLSDPIIDYFPEYLPDKVHPWLASMTIQNMLEMRTCHSKTTYNKISTTENWVESFFKTEPTHRPGTLFMYDTSSPHTLCALVEKLTGMNMLDFLKQRVLNRIGFSSNSYIIKDPFGVSMGGSGLMATSEDLLRVGLLLLNDGKDPAKYKDPDAEQLYPADYLHEAEKARVFPTGPSLNEKCSERTGYGYQFWRVPGNGYAFCGMGSQLLLCYPDDDVVISMTADTQGIPNADSMIYQSVLDLLDSLHERSDQSLTNYLDDLKFKTVTNFAPHAESVETKEFTLYDNPSGFSLISFKAGVSGGELDYVLRGKKCIIPFGIGHFIDFKFPEYGTETLASGGWLDANTFFVCCWLVGENSAAVSFKLHLTDTALTMQMFETEETVFTEYQGLLNSKELV